MPPRPFVELDHLESLIQAHSGAMNVRVACTIATDETTLPVYVLTLGNAAPQIPAIGFFGGVHGLERIGSVVVISYLESLLARLQWDESLMRKLETVRLVFMPIVNPAGMLRRTRANGRGVDLMRNAPIDATHPVPYLLGGQRISAGLPWFRGHAGDDMEAESRALCATVRNEMLPRPFSIALDCHSGFGMSDRIWFPYAHCPTPIPHLAEIHALKGIYDRSHLHHRYVFEPQSRQYLAHGDLWDYLYRDTAQPRMQMTPGARQNPHDATGADRPFLPLTLEMGSWRWVRKNPRQLFSRDGIFNPLVSHRQNRVVRRHVSWMDFLVRATGSYQRWAPHGDQREEHRVAAQRLWYP